jgi:hypothetical protein
LIIPGLRVSKGFEPQRRRDAEGRINSIKRSEDR